MKIRDRIIKSILILGSSIMLVCSIPFPSHAMAIPVESFESFYATYRALLFLGGIESPDSSSIPLPDPYLDPNYRMSLSEFEGFIHPLLSAARSYSTGLDLKIIAWMLHAIKYGQFLIPSSEFETFKAFLASYFGSTVGTSQAIASIASDGPIIKGGTVSNAVYQGTDSRNGSTVTGSISFSLPNDNYKYFAYEYLNPGPSGRTIYIANLNDNTAFTVNASGDIRYSVTPNWGVSTTNHGNITISVLSISKYGESYMTDQTITLDIPVTTFDTYKQANDYIYDHLHGLAEPVDTPVSGVIAAGIDGLSAILNSVVTPGLTLDQDDELVGQVTVTLPNFSVLNDILNNAASGVYDYATAAGLLNVGVLDPDATSQEKEDKLGAVIDFPIPILDALTSGYAKQSELAQIAGSVTDTLSQETLEKIRMGYDPDLEDPPYWPMWLNWLPPDLDFDDPAGDSTGIIPQVVNVFGVTSGWITGLLEESGAFSYLFYIGILFVLFSVVVGMYHFIGNLNYRPSGNPSVKAKINGKSVTVPTGSTRKN